MNRRTNFDSYSSPSRSVSSFPLKRDVAHSEGYRAPPGHIRMLLHEDLEFSREQHRMHLVSGRVESAASCRREIASLKRQLGIAPAGRRALEGE